MILALELFRSVPRYVAARTVGSKLPGLVAGPLAPLRLVHREDPEPRGEGWGRVRPRLAGICGSDLATVSGRSSFYFSPLVSMPFVPGHEVVGELLDDVPADGNGSGPPLRAGQRVVLDPVLSCAPRGLAACQWCAQGETSRCDRVTVGHLAPGLQTGYCADTGGGWSRLLAAHVSQLHAVPDDLPDERAVLVEPLACAVHAVRRAQVQPSDRVLIVGAGTVGLFTLLALRALTQAGGVTVVAKHGRQRELAEAFDATDVVAPDRALKALRRATRAFLLQPERGGDYLLGGADVAFECTGGRSGLDMALRTVRAGGKVILSGLPTGGADLTPLWYRELELVGAYATGRQPGAADARPPAGPDGPGANGWAEGSPARSRTSDRSDFDVALEIAATAPLDGVVGAVYPLGRWRDALDHAFGAGKLGTLKVAFDPSME
jgi:threonine dehydrogenase-like Zn-dependent dehydrogenase